MGELTKRVRPSLGLLNANLLYICMEVRMSPLPVAQASHYVKEVELGHSHLFRSAAYGKWAELSI